MLFYLLLIVGSFFGTCLLGYWVHWSFHQKWSGPFYRSHYVHHFEKYLSNDMFSDTYRSAGLDSSGLWMPLVFLPLIGFLIYTMVAGWLAWATGLTVLGTALLTGWLHEYIHDATHLNKHWLQMMPGFSRLVQLHFQHHLAVQSNLGIFLFVFDRLFGTFKNSES